jgi:hypothetical protein
MKFSNFEHQPNPIMTKKYLRLGLLPAGLLLAMNANAATISINFDTGNIDSATLGGAAPNRVTNWNAWGNTTNLTSTVDSAGVATTLTASGTSTNRSQRGNPSGLSNDELIFTSVIDVTSSASVTLSSVPYALYDVYVYMHDESDDRAGSFTIGSTTYYARGIGGSEGVGDPDSSGGGYVLSSDTTQGTGADIDQGNYVLFTGLSDASFTLNMVAVNAGDTINRNKVAGIQIVETIPEPSSALLAVIGVGLGSLRRRR